MQVLENLKIKEKVYTKKMKNGLTVMFIPKKCRKKYVIWGTHYGSNDSKFMACGEKDITEVPKGVAHFLEHKMFEQESGKNSLDVLSALGVNANAYTTNNHTAYLFECTDNFYSALDELMDYVQHPYFTDENVEKEKGIIGQEIMMYDDYPEWKVYLNCLEAMYHNNPVKLDITGTIDTISEIDKGILYKCYNTFYNPSNMCMVISGDFNPNEIFDEVEKRLVDIKPSGEIKRIYDLEDESVVKNKIEANMEVSIPLFTIGFKCIPQKKNKKVKNHIAIEILLNMIIGESSKLYQELYKEGKLFQVPSFDYEFTDDYAHILISGASKDPDLLYSKLDKEIENMKIQGLNNDDFIRIKKMLYGTYIKEFDDVQDISRMFLSDYMKGINSFDYLEEIDFVDIEYVKKVLVNSFNKEKIVYSVIKQK